MGRATGEAAREPGAANTCPECGYDLRAPYAEFPIRKKLLRRIQAGKICAHSKRLKCPECGNAWNAPCLGTPLGPNMPCAGHAGNIKPFMRKAPIETGERAAPSTIYRHILAAHMDNVPADLLLTLTTGVDRTLDTEIGLLRLRLMLLESQYAKGMIGEDRYNGALDRLVARLESLISANARNRLTELKITRLEGGAHPLDLWDPINDQ